MKIIQSLLMFGLFVYAGSAGATLNVFACEPEWAALAEMIGGDKLDVYSATTGKQDPHHIEARPSLIAKTRRADLLFCTGAELEVGWLPVLLRKAGNGRIASGTPGYLMATNHLQLLDKPQHVDRSMGDVHAAGNPHVHLDPRNILRVAEVLTQRLQQLDAANANFYQQSFDQFSTRWQAAIVQWQQQASPLQGLHFAVNHKSWVYLANWLGLDMNITLEPYPGVPPSTDDLARLIKQMKQQTVSAIIYSAHSNPRAALWLSERSDIPTVELPFTVGGSAAAHDLFSLFDETLRLLNAQIAP